MAQFFCQMLYSIIWHIFIPIWLILQIPNILKGKTQRVKDRLALYPKRESSEKKCIWFHGSSLGEIISLFPLMKKMEASFPHLQILSCSTDRGMYIAQKESCAHQNIYLPLDIEYIVKKSLKKMQPDALVIFETEIWPALFWQCNKQNIPIIVISGRISQKSYPRYRFAKSFFSRVITSAYFLMKTEEDMQRILHIGADASKTILAGDIKLDGIKTELSEEDTIFLHKNFPVSTPVIVAGSTHNGEEKILFEIFSSIRKNFPHATLIIAPRHLKRIGEVTTLLKKMKCAYTLRSDLPQVDIKNIIVLDTYGELSKVYTLADIVFVGGTIVPIGGHNLMEAAAFRKPVIFGQYTSSCRRQAQLLLEKEAGFRVKSKQELQLCIEKLIHSPDERKVCGEKAYKVIVSNQGAMDRTIRYIKNIIKEGALYAN